MSEQLQMSAGWAAVLLNLVAFLCGVAFLLGGMSARLGNQQPPGAAQSATPGTLYVGQCPPGTTLRGTTLVQGEADTIVLVECG